MRRTVGATVLALAAIGVASPAYATSPPEHFSLAFDEDAVSSTVAGLGAGCPAFTGTLTEDRHLSIDGWIKSDGTAHAQTVATATVRLVPDDTAAVSYVGGYTQRQVGQFTNHGEDDRVVTATTHGTLTGSDGSSTRISEVIHYSLGADGTVHAWFDRFRCEG